MPAVGVAGIIVSRAWQSGERTNPGHYATLQLSGLPHEASQVFDLTAGAGGDAGYRY